MNTFTKLTSALAFGVSLCMAGNATETNTIIPEAERERAIAIANLDRASVAWDVAKMEVLNTPENMEYIKRHADILQKYERITLAMQLIHRLSH